MCLCLSLKRIVLQTSLPVPSLSPACPLVAGGGGACEGICKPAPLRHLLCFQMTGRYDMYARELAEAVQPDYRPHIVRE